MHSSSTIVLNTAALKSNIAFIRSRLNENVRFSSVVKGNAYGHGMDVYVPMAEKCGIDHFSVFSAGDAYVVSQSTSTNSTILIMGDLTTHDMDWVIEQDIEFFVFDIERVKAALAVAKRVKKPAKIHIEIETGLNRTGFDLPGLKPLVAILKDNREHLHVEGLCTHYAGAESVANHVRVQKQIKRYTKLHEWLKGQGISPAIRHTACSAAAMMYPKTQMDLVRIGILQYGFWPSKEVFIDYLSKLKGKDKKDPLKRIISWSSYVMSIKKVKTGEFIGYGTSFLAQHNMTIATIPVGYAHGYSRILSNQGHVLINDKRAPVIGIINMNMMMVDITERPDIKKETEVLLIGGHGEAVISIASFGELSNQLNYELLTRLPHDIPRITE